MPHIDSYVFALISIVSIIGNDSFLGLLKTIIAGGMGGVSLWATIYPADVIKSKSQVRSLLVIKFAFTM